MTERSILKAMCGVQLKDRKKSVDLMFMFCLNEAVDQLAVANSVCWYGHVWLLRREDCHILRMALGFEVEGQRRNGRPKRMWKKQNEEEGVIVGLRMEDVL